mmetsp:Transcript_25380/g.70104  ORF Transcript_25380/g.70104 Transcript_25380/m.70104 type:complete len:357 (+) Transcript_25380:800-1870(+)
MREAMPPFLQAQEGGSQHQMTLLVVRHRKAKQVHRRRLIASLYLLAWGHRVQRHKDRTHLLLGRRIPQPHQGKGTGHFLQIYCASQKTLGIYCKRMKMMIMQSKSRVFFAGAKGKTRLHRLESGAIGQGLTMSMFSTPSLEGDQGEGRFTVLVQREKMGERAAGPTLAMVHRGAADMRQAVNVELVRAGFRHRLVALRRPFFLLQCSPSQSQGEVVTKCLNLVNNRMSGHHLSFLVLVAPLFHHRKMFLGHTCAQWHRHLPPPLSLRPFSSNHNRRLLCVVYPKARLLGCSHLCSNHTSRRLINLGFLLHQALSFPPQMYLPFRHHLWRHRKGLLLCSTRGANRQKCRLQHKSLFR